MLRQGLGHFLGGTLEEVKARSSPLPKSPYILAVCTWFGPYNLWSGGRCEFLSQMGFSLPRRLQFILSLASVWQAWGSPCVGACVCTSQNRRRADASVLALTQEAPLQMSGRHRLNWRNSAAKLSSPVWERNLKNLWGSCVKLRVLCVLRSPHQGFNNLLPPPPHPLLRAFRGNKHMWRRHSIPSHAWKYPEFCHDHSTSQRGA